MARPLPVLLATPADELRELLNTAEKQAANLHNSGPRALDLLLNLDRLAELWPQIEAAGVDLRPEAGRWTTLLAVVRQKAPLLLGELRGSGGLPGLRAAHHPDGEAAWWWHLAETTQRETRRRWLTAAGVALGILAVVSLALFVLNRLFPVDPRLREALSRQTAGQQKLEREGDYAAAAVEFERAAELMPGDPENWLYLAAVREHLGDSAAAQQAFERARALLPDEFSYRSARGVMYLRVQELDKAQADLEAALTLNPDSAEAHYFVAGVYEQQGRLPETAQALERASALAEKRGQVELTALARYRLAMVLQQLQAQVPLPRTRTPTP